jgi:ankyrin repeat protein
MYAARGGYADLLEFLVVNCKASPLKQDSSGATLFHHAIEKGNLEVLLKILSIGADFISAIEIADNAGRTPLFEAIDNNVHEELLKMLLMKRAKNPIEGGFGAKVNVLNYNGQTPVFSAVREGNIELLKVLVESGSAEVDKNAGEMVKDDAEEGG